ncbi:MAG TPA: glycosyltransferase [Xanthobacteraceae bacterium]|nr:glycosyltransferase [Xanthobacteraceae bacterium]
MPAEIAGFAESAGLAGRADAGMLAHAAQRAERLGIGADEVLLAAGSASPDRLAIDAARRLGVGFDPLDETPPGLAERPRHELLALLRTGVLRHRDGGLTFAVRGLGLRRLADMLGRDPALRRRVRITTPERLAALVWQTGADGLAEHAAFFLRRARPHLSAATLGLARYLLAAFAVLLAAVPFAAMVVPELLVFAGMVLVACVLLVWNAFRISACVQPQEPDPAPERDDARLPAYTIIVPLYREARVVPKLIAALKRLDYPREKLQILLAIEADDHETRAVAARHATAPLFEMVPAPELGPRTKPKALNAALALARGELVAVYDAEDEPDPRQLRLAHAAFRSRSGRIGCVQARLVIDNVEDSWITRQFAAEYAGNFDLLLPLLDGLGLPIPLGGTSNHFRRDVLEAIGAWDPYNVTEDADLGIRLSRAGWRTAVIASGTREEAPNRFHAWLRQRTRWYKGWLQTVLVHGRHPVALRRALGTGATAGLAVLLGGSLVTPLVHPFFVLALLIDLFAGGGAARTPAAVLTQALCMTTLIAGYASAALFAAAGMRRRRLGGTLAVLPLIPLYWLMLSLAVWRAVLQLVVDPYRWEKTEHGLARSSRAAKAKNSAAVRPRTRPAAASD